METAWERRHITQTFTSRLLYTNGTLEVQFRAFLSAAQDWGTWSSAWPSFNVVHCVLTVLPAGTNTATVSRNMLPRGFFFLRCSWHRFPIAPVPILVGDWVGLIADLDPPCAMWICVSALERVMLGRCDSESRELQTHATRTWLEVNVTLSKACRGVHCNATGAIVVHVTVVVEWLHRQQRWWHEVEPVVVFFFFVYIITVWGAFEHCHFPFPCLQLATLFAAYQSACAMPTVESPATEQKST